MEKAFTDTDSYQNGGNKPCFWQITSKSSLNFFHHNLPWDRFRTKKHHLQEVCISKVWWPISNGVVSFHGDEWVKKSPLKKEIQVTWMISDISQNPEYEERPKKYQAIPKFRQEEEG